MNIGILGGGQLSKMLALAGIPLGFRFIFYFPETPHSLHQLGEIINGSYDNLVLLSQFAKQVDVITYENENIPAETIDYLAKLTPVYPDKKAISISQDRLIEKSFFFDLGIPTNQFMNIDDKRDIVKAIEKFGYPLILKKRTHGYDGKGQFKINENTPIETIPHDYFHNTIAEEYIAFDREVSLIVAKNNDGTVYYDICENIHENGILRKTRAIKNDVLFDLAHNYVDKIINKLNYKGILAVEFFQIGTQLLANEMAPRVHNSGHWTIDACMTSQFENHLRAITDLPLGNPASLTEAIMFNILNRMPEKSKLLEMSGLCLHDYAKSSAPGRKLGHVTLLMNGLTHAVTQIETILK